MIFDEEIIHQNRSSIVSDLTTSPSYDLVVSP